ncbi:hypothetical protein J4Q44_G00374460 [Coregonus suidteri]|uniref:Uncharacterized protein n=1 Tax=Coregonus suidteri TaxID=861788 RepID=A0AAN8KMM5_9TELE
MKWLLLLCLCVYAVRCQDDYDEYDLPKTVVDPRGHRPSSRGSETYSPARNSPPPVSGGSQYRGRPTAAPARGTEQEKDEQPEAGGCTHASEW